MLFHLYIQLKFGKNVDDVPRNGRWNFNNKVIVCKDFCSSLNSLLWIGRVFLLFVWFGLNLQFYPLFALQTLYEPIAVKNWAVVNFSFPCDSSRISRDLINCGMKKGIVGSAYTVSIFKLSVVLNYMSGYLQSLNLVC